MRLLLTLSIVALAVAMPHEAVAQPVRHVLTSVERNIDVET